MSFAITRHSWEEKCREAVIAIFLNSLNYPRPRKFMLHAYIDATMFLLCTVNIKMRKYIRPKFWVFPQHSFDKTPAGKQKYAKIRLTP